MEDFDNLEKLAKLRDKDIVTEEEYLALKKDIISRHSGFGNREENKSGVAYILLGWFLGIFGAHNFYAGYMKRATAQILLTLISGFLLFIPLVIVQIWSLGDICFINKDADGAPFIGDRNLMRILRVAAVAFFIFIYFSGAVGMYAALNSQVPPQVLLVR